MNLFLDKSALVKLYVVEPRSEYVHSWVAAANFVAVARIAWAEFMAATAARQRLLPGSLSLLGAISALRRDWPNFAKVEVSQALVERAGELASAYALRGYDSVQLAAAEFVLRVSQRLASAAQALGLTLPAQE